VQLGLENKKKTMWAAALGVAAVLLVAYEFMPMFTESSTPTSSAQAAAPLTPTRATTPRTKGKIAPSKKARPAENLDPTLRLDLLAMSEQTRYEGNGRNIFVSQAEEIPIPIKTVRTDDKKAAEDTYHAPTPPPPTPIPLKFYGFASSPGEAKKIFLKMGEDVFVAGEGEIVDRRYKVVHINNNAVMIQDMVGSGPPQNIPLTQG
jgi:hypothetical protein